MRVLACVRVCLCVVCVCARLLQPCIMHKMNPMLLLLQALCKALARNTTVRQLILAESPIGRDGAYLLAEMLHSNTSLNELVRYLCCVQRHLGQARPAERWVL